jgi:hypothetical protein
MMMVKKINQSIIFNTSDWAWHYFRNLIGNSFLLFWVGLGAKCFGLCVRIRVSYTHRCI